MGRMGQRRHIAKLGGQDEKNRKVFIFRFLDATPLFQ
jgi:hypothetical protein